VTPEWKFCKFLIKQCAAHLGAFIDLRQKVVKNEINITLCQGNQSADHSGVQDLSALHSSAQTLGGKQGNIYLILTFTLLTLVSLLTLSRSKGEQLEQLREWRNV